MINELLITKGNNYEDGTISVSDKTGAVEFANELIRQSFTIYSTEEH